MLVDCSGTVGYLMRWSQGAGLAWAKLVLASRAVAPLIQSFELSFFHFLEQLLA